MSSAQVGENLDRVRERVALACQRAGRSVSDVRLIAVSKGQPASAIEAAALAGQRVFGENYVKELVQKSSQLSFVGLEWRFIGHLQRNKVREVLQSNARIDALDSLSLAEEVDRRALEKARIVDAMIQVNIGRESQKHGCAPEDLGALLFSLQSLPRIRVRGLMCIPPAGTPESSRVYFQLLRDLAKEHGLAELSMGMSEDLEVAIEEGATEVRIGTAIFGPRAPR